MARASILLAFAVLQTATAFVPTTGRPPMMARRSTGAPLKMGAMDIDFKDIDGSDVRVGIITTRWNPEIITSLQGACKDTLLGLGVNDTNIFETEVPGAFELPLAARFLALSGTVDAVICIGCLIKGDTQHFEYISQSVSSGLMSVGLQTSTPVVFGVLTVNTEQQALDRASGDDNHGISWAKTAVEMSLLRKQALGIGKSSGMGFGVTGKVGEDGEKKEFGFGF